MPLEVEQAEDRVRVTSRTHMSEHDPIAWEWIESHLGQMATGNVLGSVAALRRAMKIEPEQYETATVAIIHLDQALERPDVLMRERRRFDEQYALPLTSQAPPHTNAPDPHRRLRVGYLSADFCDHSASQSFIDILEHCNQDQFEPYLYMTGNSLDDQTSVFKKLGVWRPVYRESPERIAERIRSDQIDILVDLSGYSAGNRVMALARKPAPIQVTAWGSGIGTGLSCMDYLLSDEIMIPSSHKDIYREQILYQPTMMGYSIRWITPPISSAPRDKNGYVTFGYFGRPIKISHETAVAWGQILAAVPNSRLYLKYGGYENEAMLQRILLPILAFGVEPERITVSEQSSRLEHLQAYGEIDIALDTWPENGGVTTCDAFLMGVPTVTRLGRLAPGRVGSSLVHHMALPYAPDTDGYIDQAIDWGLHPEQLPNRVDIRRRFLASDICNGPKRTRSWEDSLRQIWKEWCEERVRSA